MRVHRPGIWLSGLLTLSLVGCTILSLSKEPKSEPVATAPMPSETVTQPPAPTEVPSPPAEARKEVAVAQAPPAPPAPPPAPPPPPPPPLPALAPAQRGRFVVLNFDNADIEVVIHAASEIVGFNYVLAPDVRGKVTIQTSARIPQEEDRKSTRLNSSHIQKSRMPSSA